MASQLGLYNEALMLLGQRSLANLTENVESRRILDEYWDVGVKYCIEQGFWDWSIRAVGITPEPGLATSWGYANAFLKPVDWVRTFQVSADENFSAPLTRYTDENGYWFADPDTIYVQYVSNHPGFGFNLAIWPETFSRYVALHLARQVCRRVTNGADLFADLYKLEGKMKADALSKDAINDGVRKPPPGTWVMSRGFGSQASRWDRTFR